MTVSVINGVGARNQDGLIALYEQACENARAYMDLRFKHFTTFMFLTGLLGAITFQVEALKTFRLWFCLAAITLSILFWLLDNRTSYYQRREIVKANYYETLIDYTSVVDTSRITTFPPRFSIPAGFITNLIFFVVVLAWCFVSYIELPHTSSEQTQPPRQQAVPTATPKETNSQTIDNR